MRLFSAVKTLGRFTAISRTCLPQCSFSFQPDRLFSHSTTLCSSDSKDTTHDPANDPPPKRKPYVPMPIGSDPWERIKHVSKFEGEQLWDTIRMQKRDLSEWEGQIFPQFCDILIVGGGIMGSVIAYYMKEKCPEALTIVVVEKDPSYAKSASVTSMGTVRVQFSDEQNVKNALFGAEFLRTMNEHLKIRLEEEHEPRNIEFQPQGYLFLGTQADVAQMEINHETQQRAGAKVALMKQDALRLRYPYMNFEDIAMGSYGLEHEGWYDPWQFLCALKERNMSFGIHYVDGEVVDFPQDDSMGIHNIASVGGQRMERIKHALVKTREHGTQSIQFAACVNAAGHNSANVAKMAGIGSKEKGLRILPLPVEKRKRLMFLFHCPDGPMLSFPILVDPNGLFVRRNGVTGMYMCSWVPKTNSEEPDPNDPLGNETFFQEVLWPKLVYRVPVFQQLQLRGSWATFYDYNYFDQSGVVGFHPYHDNFCFATGFSGYGLSMAPAVGHAVQDIILESRFVTHDMGRFSFERFIHFEPTKESVLV